MKDCFHYNHHGRRGRSHLYTDKTICTFLMLKGMLSRSMLLSPSFWRACRKALGATKGRSPGELIDQLGHGDVAEDIHADQALHGYTATAQGRTPSSPSSVMMSSRGMRLESDSNWAALLAWRKSRAWSIRIKIRNQINRFRILIHQEDRSMDP